MFFLHIQTGEAQSVLPVTNYSNENHIRFLQLSDSLYQQSSFTIRPFVLPDNDSLQTPWNRQLSKKSSGIKWQYLPFIASLQHNTNTPFERNDGSMIPAAGLQALLSTGVVYKNKHWRIQLNPELILAANKPYEGFRREHDSLTWSIYYEWLNNSDIPEQFGSGTYVRLLPGQSSIRYRTGNLCLALSTENIWWGPGIYNSLVLSNNAPGFLHLSASSQKPVQTKFGSFEWQVIAGNLSSSGFPPPGTDITFNGTVLYRPKKIASRYITGMAVTWQPKWIKGLFLGFTKMSYQYYSDIAGPIDILPLAGVLGQKVSSSEKEDQKATLSSLFFRYLMPADQAEVYFEYGYGDRVITPFNLFSSESIPKAYTGGIRKLVSLNKRSQYIQITTEITQMQLDKPSLIRGLNSWYTHPYIRQGYTNNGQMLGSSIGSGSNSQHLDISYVKDRVTTGIGFERIVRNNDFYYKRYESIKDYRRHWVDLSVYLHTAGWQFKNFALSGEVIYTSSINYKWYILKDDIYHQYENGNDIKNLQFKINLIYSL